MTVGEIEALKAENSQLRESVEWSHKRSCRNQKLIHELQESVLAEEVGNLRVVLEESAEKTKRLAASNTKIYTELWALKDAAEAPKFQLTEADKNLMFAFIDDAEELLDTEVLVRSNVSIAKGNLRGIQCGVNLDASHEAYVQVLLASSRGILFDVKLPARDLFRVDRFLTISGSGVAAHLFPAGEWDES